MRPVGLTWRTVYRTSRFLLVLCLVCSSITASPLERGLAPTDTELEDSKGEREHRQARVKTLGRGNGEEEEDHEQGDQPPEQSAEIARLLDAFGLKNIPRPNRTAVTMPPAFMVNLYHQLERTAGSTRPTSNTPRANTVRSFNEKGTMGLRHKYLFDTSSVLDRETILAAELHLYKQKPKSADGWTDDMISSQVVCELYQLHEHVENGFPSESRTLLDTKVLNASHRGWVHFNVTRAFERRPAPEGQTASDKLFEIRIKSDRDLPRGVIVFSKRKRPRRQDHRPLLVLFLDDKNVRASDIILPGAAENPTSQDSVRKESLGSQEEMDVEESEQESDRERSARLKRRASSRTGNRGKDKCKLYDYYVDFTVIGWSNWVIAPNGYTANYCEGDCPFPLDRNFNATNHATVQAILHVHTGSFRNSNRRLPNPCCVPATLESIHVLYLDDLNNVVLKEFSDMIATSCGCQ